MPTKTAPGRASNRQNAAAHCLNRSRRERCARCKSSSPRSQRILQQQQQQQQQQPKQRSRRRQQPRNQRSLRRQQQLQKPKQNRGRGHCARPKSQIGALNTHARRIRSLHTTRAPTLKAGSLWGFIKKAALSAAAATAANSRGADAALLHPASTDGENSAPAGYAVLTDNEAAVFRNNFPSMLYGSNMPRYWQQRPGKIMAANHTGLLPEMRLFNETVLANPSDHPTEALLASIGTQMKLADDAVVFPAYVTKREYGDEGDFKGREIHSDAASTDFILESLPTQYNYNPRNKLTSVVFLHSAAADNVSSSTFGFTPIMKASLRVTDTGRTPTPDDIEQPPKATNLVTFFESDRLHAGPLVPRRNANVFIGLNYIVEPHHDSNGTVVPVIQTQPQFSKSLSVIDSVINEILYNVNERLPASAIKTELLQFVEQYKQHRHDYVFSTKMDSVLQWKLATAFKTENIPLTDLTHNIQKFCEYAVAEDVTLDVNGPYPSVYSKEREIARNAVRLQVSNSKNIPRIASK